MRTKRVLVALLALGSLGGRETPAAAATRAELKCRNAIVGNVTGIVKGGLKTIATCHKARNRGGAQGDCNALDRNITGTPFSQAVNRAEALVANACRGAGSVLQNYPERDVTGSVFPAVERLLEQAGGDLQGAPNFVGAPDVKARSKCHNAIGAGEKAVVLEALKSSTKCQKRLDRRAQTLGPIAPQCILGAPRASGKATSKMSRACGSLSGLEVGSCASLPGCVVDEATRTGQAVARLTYGGPTQCGNGIPEIGEDCDDGNTDPSDECTGTCTVARCGDGVVQAGVEECDDIDDRDPADGCHECRLPVCGDSIVSVGEECDDGNATPNDGCTNCTSDPLFCGTTGVDATVRVPYDDRVPLAAIKLTVGYPAFLGIPGTGLDTDATRVTDLTGVGGLFIPNDQDGTIIVTKSAAPATIPAGDFVRLRFDCPQGSPIRPQDLACMVVEAADRNGLDVDPSTVPCSIPNLALP